MYALNKIVGYLISSVGFSMVLAVITADGAPVWANLKPEQGVYLYQTLTRITRLCRT